MRRIALLAIITISLLTALVVVAVSGNNTAVSEPEHIAARAKAPVIDVTPAPPPPTTTTTSTIPRTTAPRASRSARRTYPVPSGDAKMFIYMRESGNRPEAVNGGGCVGLGQNCPDKHGRIGVVIACPNWRTDYACQDAWFTGYCMNRYGSWENARSFWIAHRWW